MFACKNWRRYSRELASQSLQKVSQTLETFLKVRKNIGGCTTAIDFLQPLVSPSRNVRTSTLRRHLTVTIAAHLTQWGSGAGGQANRAVRHRSIGQTWEGSFSAVSKPNFASKYSLESSRRDLHNALLCTALISHFFQKVARFCQTLWKFFRNFANFAKI